MHNCEDLLELHISIPYSNYTLTFSRPSVEEKRVKSISLSPLDSFTSRFIQVPWKMLGMELEDSLITYSVTHINGQCWETLKIFNLKSKTKHSTYLWKWFELNGLLEMAVENLKLVCKFVLNALLFAPPDA